MKIEQPAGFRHLIAAVSQRLTERTPHKQGRATSRLAIRSNLQAGGCENPAWCIDLDPYFCKQNPAACAD